MSLKNQLPILDRAVLEELPTRSLLGRLRRLQRCEQSAVNSDASPEEIAHSTGIVFKDSLEWRTAYEHLKAILDEREHVPTGSERRIARNERARSAGAVEHRRRR